MRDTDGWCIECGEEFHFDDTGGYNPPCACSECQGFYCRTCCVRQREGYDESRPEDDDMRPPELR